jgi:hypothetical protein
MFQTRSVFIGYKYHTFLLYQVLNDFELSNESFHIDFRIIVSYTAGVIAKLASSHLFKREIRNINKNVI